MFLSVFAHILPKNCGPKLVFQRPFRGGRLLTGAALLWVTQLHVWEEVQSLQRSSLKIFLSRFQTCSIILVAWPVPLCPYWSIEIHWTPMKMFDHHHHHHHHRHRHRHRHHRPHRPHRPHRHGHRHRHRDQGLDVWMTDVAVNEIHFIAIWSSLKSIDLIWNPLKSHQNVGSSLIINFDHQLGSLSSWKMWISVESARKLSSLTTPSIRGMTWIRLALITEMADF